MELKNTISSIENSKVNYSNNYSSLDKEFKLYGINKTLTPNLEKLFDALKTVQPTSTESERVFSVANIFSTKIRNHLQFSMLNALVFLKFYFMNENKF